MAGRNRSVAVYLPEGLILLVKNYQDARSKPTFSAAIIELLETHPGIAIQVERVYALAKDVQSPQPVEAAQLWGSLEF
jgi:hypothetical protein